MSVDEREIVNENDTIVALAVASEGSLPQHAAYEPEKLAPSQSRDRLETLLKVYGVSKCYAEAGSFLTVAVYMDVHDGSR